MTEPQSSAPDSQDYRVPLKTKLAFGIGASGESIALFAFATYAFFYYNQVLGLSGALAGLATTIALCFDAISDPLIGSISDRWKSRWGRRHPFMFAAAIPLGIFYFCIFSPPTGLTEFQLFLWFSGFSVLMRVTMTLFNIPHLAFGAELSSNYDQRSTVMAYNSIFGWVGGASIFLIANLVFFSKSPEFDNGLLNGLAYPAFGATASVLITSMILVCVWLTRDQIERLPKGDPNAPPFSWNAFFGELVDAMSNRNYLMLLLGLLFLSLTIGTRETISLHMYTYYWELVPEQLVWNALGTAFAFALAFVGTPWLHRRIDKRATTILAVALLAFFAVAPVTGRLLGIMPENGDGALLPIILVFVAGAYSAGAILGISVMSMLADIADQHELKSGLRKQGVFYSARTFFSKATSALGHLVGGIAIDVIGFPENARPGEVDADVLLSLALLDGPIAAIPALVAIVCYAQYRISRAQHREIRAALDARAAASNSANAPPADPDRAGSGSA